MINLLLLAAALQSQQIDTMALRAHTRFLSSDELEGRGTGTRGEAKAAAYIESQLRQLGVKAAASGSYLQLVPLRQATIDSAQVTLNTGSDSLRFRKDQFVINGGAERALQGFAGDLLMVSGTAEQAATLEPTAIAGRVLVLLGSLGADAETLVPRWLAAGVRGVILMVPDSAQFPLLAASRGASRYFTAAPVNDPVWQSELPVVLAGPSLTRALLVRAGPQLARLENSSGLQVIPLNTHVRVAVNYTVREVRANNIFGVIPGTDPRLRNQVVLYTAHYDHLGIGAPDAAGDSIYNGFADNAAGVAMLLAIAKDLVKNPLPRSVAFLFLTGEERGLLGSTYYASAPLLPLDSTIAVINLDAGAPPAPPVEWRIAGGAGNRLGELARQVGAQRGWQVNLGEASPNSDYWPFRARGVNAVFIIPGGRWEGVTTAQRDALRARWDRYHHRDDEFSEQFPFAGLRRYAEFALEVGRVAASAGLPR
jgi:peptidase M28-like protein